MRTPLGNVARFAAGLQELGAGIYAWMQPNGGLGESNAGLIVGKGESLLIDTLWDLRLTREMLKGIARPTAHAPVRTLVNTHADGDHCWGNQLVKGAEIIAGDATAAHFADEVPRKLAALGATGRFTRPLARRALPLPGGATVQGLTAFAGQLAAFDFRGIELTPPTRTFSGSLVLDVGGRRVELLEVGPAHTEGDTIVHVPRARTVFAADIMFAGVTPIMWAGPVENWIAALDAIVALEPEVVVPGHGPVTDLATVLQVRNYWTTVTAAARARHARGVGVIDAALEIAASPELNSAGFTAWDEPGRLVVNVAMLYRSFDGREGRIGETERARLLAQMPRVAAAARGAA